MSRLDHHPDRHEPRTRAGPTEGSGDPIGGAIRAVTAGMAGDGASAQQQLQSARHHARAAARRQRQVIEIADVIVAGNNDRAIGLSLQHTEEFPDDADLLDRLLNCNVRDASGAVLITFHRPGRTGSAK